MSTLAYNDCAKSCVVPDRVARSISNWKGGNSCETAPVMSRSEVTAHVELLTPAQKTALVKFARLYARKTAYEWEDLLQEALSRVLACDRSWRRDLPVVAFLAGVMRSIAWEWKRTKDSTVEEVDVGDEGAEASGVLARLDITRVLSLFDDDPVAKKMVTEMMLGTRAEELREVCGLTPIAYESIRRKIRRRIEKLQLA